MSPWKTYRRRLVHPLGLPFLAIVTAFVYSTDTFASSRCAELPSGISRSRENLVQFDPKTFEFRGLTPQGLRAMKKARDGIRKRARLFDNEFRNLGTVHHAGMVARLSRGNMLLYGPPGGAKSAIVNWLMKGEPEPPFKLLMHQMLTEQAFTGGQNYFAAKEGRFEINTKGSLTDFAVALIDEVENGGPAAYSSLFTLLNEREVLAGNQVIKARLETLFATSNSNLPEIFQQFVENGQGSKAAPFLNRFQIKALVYNWLGPKDQAVLDQRRQRLRYLKALAETHPEVLKDEVFLEPNHLDWPAMRQLANSLFEFSPLFMTIYREFINDMRKQTNRAIRESEERHQNNRLAEPFVYFPSADYAERLRLQIPEIILMSVFVDFLMSPLANDATLEQVTHQQILLDPLSLWRGYLVMTTIGPGKAKLKFDRNSQRRIDIDFDWAIDPSAARDTREELLIRNLGLEQGVFQRVLLNHLESAQKQIELRARNAGQGDSFSMENASFELLMMHYKGE